MKKLIMLLLILSCISIFASCGKNEEPIDEEKVFETAETYVELSDNSGSLSLNENIAKSMLEIYPKENLGLSKEIYDYRLELSVTRFMDNDACLVEAFNEGEEKPEGTFVISGQDCFVYNPKTQKYLLLTADGVVEIKPVTTTEAEKGQTTTEQAFDYDTENNQKLQEKFSSYSKEKLGIEKDLSEYVLLVTGTTTTAENGEMVYVVRLYRKNGEATNYTLAFNENNDFVFDDDVNKYVEL